MYPTIYGKLPSGERLQRIKASPNYKNGSFQNVSKTNAMAEDVSFFKTLRDFINKPKNAIPAFTIPSHITDLKRIQETNPTVVWFGHSSYLIYINNKTILVDPVFSGNAAPLSFMIKAFKGANNYSVNDMPEIDILILTHDHYDHLDHKTLLELNSKVKKIVCSLGVGTHLEYWGISKNKITELDWHETFEDNDLSLTTTSGRHFSGRGITRGQTLWSAFILKTNTHNLFLGGDSGYDNHYKEIGEKYGPFDLAILEAGQYNVSWPHIHMMPEETVQASIDLKANVLLPVHWGKFALAFHEWNEPIKRVLKKASELKVTVTTPLIGEPLIIGKTLPNSIWWDLK